MKEMEYSAERKIEVLDTGYFYGLLYYIMNLGTHPTAYVKIPETHWLYNVKDYDDMPIECHYGLTFLDDYLRISDTEKVEGRFIGWDYGHCTDYAGYFETLNIGLDGTEAKKWTTEEIQKEVKDVCYQIIELEKKKPSEAKENKTMTNADIQVGEYVRTTSGFIAKCIEKDEYSLGFDDSVRVSYGELWSNLYSSENDVLNHSFNLIDLIEVGDYVNGTHILTIEESTYTKIGKKAIRILVYRDHRQDCWETLFEEEIKSIVTKEQMEAMQYVI